MQSFARKLSSLSEAVDVAQARLRAQDDILLRMRKDTAELRARYDSLGKSAQATLEALRKIPQAQPRRPSPVRPLIFEGPAVPFYDEPVPPARATRIWLPYAAIAAAAVAFMFGLPRLEAAARPALAAPAARPVEALKPVLPIDFSARAGGPTPVLDGEPGRNDSERALGLVYGFVPPGARRSVRELVPAGPSLVQKIGGGKFLVTLRPGDSPRSPIYDFEVDLDLGTVEPSQETEAGLQDGAPRLADRG